MPRIPFGARVPPVPGLVRAAELEGALPYRRPTKAYEGDAPVLKARIRETAAERLAPTLRTEPPPPLYERRCAEISRKEAAPARPARRIKSLPPRANTMPAGAALRVEPARRRAQSVSLAIDSLATGRLAGNILETGEVPSSFSPEKLSKQEKKEWKAMLTHLSHGHGNSKAVQQALREAFREEVSKGFGTRKAALISALIGTILSELIYSSDDADQNNLNEHLKEMLKTVNQLYDEKIEAIELLKKEIIEEGEKLKRNIDQLPPSPEKPVLLEYAQQAMEKSLADLDNYIDQLKLKQNKLSNIEIPEELNTNRLKLQKHGLTLLSSVIFLNPYTSTLFTQLLLSLSSSEMSEKSVKDGVNHFFHQLNEKEGSSEIEKPAQYNNFIRDSLVIEIACKTTPKLIGAAFGQIPPRLSSEFTRSFSSKLRDEFPSSFLGTSAEGLSGIVLTSALSKTDFRQLVTTGQIGQEELRRVEEIETSLSGILGESKDDAERRFETIHAMQASAQERVDKLAVMNQTSHKAHLSFLKFWR